MQNITHLSDNVGAAKESLPRLAYSLNEAAQILGISYITAFRLCQRGKLRSCGALRTKLIAKTEIERFLRDTTEVVA